MKVETTLNVHREVLSELHEASFVTGRRVNAIAVMALQGLLVHYRRRVQAFRRIQYQDRDKKENWTKVHIVIGASDYECLLDMRKMYKMSVSFLLAVAVKRYLYKIVKDILCGVCRTDNYLYSNYIISQKVIDGVTTLHIYWGVPRLEHLKRTLYAERYT